MITKNNLILGTIEFLEQFANIGIKTLFVLFLISFLKIDVTTSFWIFGVFAASLFIFSILGAHIADKYWGIGKTIKIGFIVIVIGMGLILISSLIYNSQIEVHQPIININECNFFIGLILFILGTSLIEVNMLTSCRLIEDNEDNYLSSFLILTLFGALGTIISPIILGAITDSNPYLFKYCFIVLFVILVIALILFFIFIDKYGNEKFNLTKEKTTPSLKKVLTTEKIKGLIYIIIPAIIFSILADQQFTSITYIATNYISPYLTIGSFSFDIRVQYYIAIANLTTLIGYAWLLKYSSKLKFDTIGFFKICCIINILGYGILFAISYLIDLGAYNISPIPMIIIFILLGLSITFNYPIIFTFISKVFPETHASRALALIFVTGGIGSIISQYFGSFMPTNKTYSILNLLEITNFKMFILIFLILIIIALLILIVNQDKLRKIFEKEV